MIPIWLLMNGVIAGPLAEKEMRAYQEKLDSICEGAREAKLVPLRRKYVKECVDKGKDQAYCIRYYSDYGAPIVNRPFGFRAALFYDLPECVRAFEHKKSIKK